LNNRGEAQLRIRLAPINPSDINVIQGVYPAKLRARTEMGTPNPVFIPGNEGLGEVVKLGSGVVDLKVGDRVVMGAPQTGTWSNYMNIKADSLIPIGDGISDVQGATLSINPPTALLMLRHFVTLSPGEYVIQNGANSAVGQAVIQIAPKLGLKTINLVRERPDIDELKSYLVALGAQHVLTYDELGERSIRETIKEWTGGKPIRLGLNCVSGKDTAAMVRLLGNDAHLVSYGAMSKAPLSLPTSLFIFRNLTAHGFLLSKWFDQHSSLDRRSLVMELILMMEQGALKEPTNEIVLLDGSDETIQRQVHQALANIEAGGYGKKVLLKFAAE